MTLSRLAATSKNGGLSSNFCPPTLMDGVRMLNDWALLLKIVQMTLSGGWWLSNFVRSASNHGAAH